MSTVAQRPAANIDGMNARRAGIPATAVLGAIIAQQPVALIGELMLYNPIWCHCKAFCGCQRANIRFSFRMA